MSWQGHTAGPWTVDGEGFEELTIVTVEGDWCVAGCLPGGKQVEWANARLIAAAPDLLEAAVCADKVLEALGSDEDNSPRAELRAAIAKATEGST